MPMFPHPQFISTGLQYPTTLNPSYKSGAITLSNGNLTAISGSATWANVTDIFTATTGKYYCEFTFTGTTISTSQEFGLYIGTPNVGTEIAAQSGGLTVGIQTSSGGDCWVGASARQNINFANGVQPVLGSRWDMSIDLTNNKLWARTTQNPGKWNNSATADPGTPSTGIDISSWRGANAVGIILGTNGANCGWTANFGQSPMQGTPPVGFILGFGN